MAQINSRTLFDQIRADIKFTEKATIDQMPVTAIVELGKRLPTMTNLLSGDPNVGTTLQDAIRNTAKKYVKLTEDLKALGGFTKLQEDANRREQLRQLWLEHLNTERSVAEILQANEKTFGVGALFVGGLIIGGIFLFLKTRQ